MPDFRATAREAIHALWHSPDTALDAAAAAGLSADTSWCVSAPVEALDGRAAVLDGFVRPLRAALSHTRRRDLILIGGRNTRAPGGAWVASVCHYVGSHDAPLFGVAPSGHLAFLRAGEFYRLDDDGRIEDFDGVERWDYDPTLRVQARLVPHDEPHELLVPDVLGGGTAIVFGAAVGYGVVRGRRDVRQLPSA